MRRVLIATTIALLLMAQSAVAQEISTRAHSMGNAVTAVYDHADTLRTNPAGLGFLHRSRGFIGFDGNFTVAPPEESYDDTGEFDDDFSQESSLPVLAFDTLGRVDFVTENWGIGVERSYRSGGETYTSVTRLRAGLGFSLGPIGIGANIRHSASRSIYYAAAPAEVLSDSFLFGEVVRALGESSPTTRTSLGAGVMVRHERFSAGAAVPAIFQLRDGRVVREIDLLDPLDVGVAYRLVDVRGGEDDRTSVFRTIFSADLQNLGNPPARRLHLGTETDINLVVLGLTGRAGYIVTSRQSALPNLITLGLGGDLLFATIDAGVQFPQDYLLQGNSAYLPEYFFSAAITW
mgnify:CR=1 FL=1